MSHNLFGSRLKAMRDAAGLTQDGLAARLGFKDRQTISAIETGERRLSADELLQAVQVFGTTVEAFTDPFALVGDEGRFSWRQSGTSSQDLAAFESRAGQWIGMFRTLAPQTGCELPLLRQSLGLSKASSYEEAEAAGERFVRKFDLGDVPARTLAEVMERELGILVLMVDTIPGVSGAACRATELDAVLINRHEVEGRRHFDLAHELFHILTWHAMPPERVEDSTEISRSRTEQLANSFAGAILMPRTVVERFGDWKGMDVGALARKLNETAEVLAVTAAAVKWRLVALRILSRPVARQLTDAVIRSNRRAGAARDVPPAFSKRFVTVVALALDEGQLSTRRAATLLGTPIDDLPALFAAHGIDVPVDL